MPNLIEMWDLRALACLLQSRSIAIQVKDAAKQAAAFSFIFVLIGGGGVSSPPRLKFDSLCMCAH